MNEKNQSSNKLPISGPLPQPESVQEAWDYLFADLIPAPKHIEEIEFEVTEFTSICPRTGQPDFGTITITYKPSWSCFESKALKVYLWAFRNEGAFCESLASRIAHDLLIAGQPEWIRVTVKSNPRGGIGLQATCTRRLEE